MIFTFYLLSSSSYCRTVPTTQHNSWTLLNPFRSNQSVHYGLTSFGLSMKAPVLWPPRGACQEAKITRFSKNGQLKDLWYDHNCFNCHIKLSKTVFVSSASLMLLFETLAQTTLEKFYIQYLHIWITYLMSEMQCLQVTIYFVPLTKLVPFQETLKFIGSLQYY